MTRKGDWILTYSGVKFYPLDPRPEEILIEDIAHGLSRQCRYGGQCRRFYSVAEHSWLVSEHVFVKLRQGPEVAFWALMHDASEAYLVDIPRPIKRDIGNYLEIEAHLMAVIAEKFGMGAQMPAIVKEIDDRILADEKRQNCHPMPWDREPGPEIGTTLRYLDPDKAKDTFLWAFGELRKAMAGQALAKARATL